MTRYTTSAALFAALLMIGPAQGSPGTAPTGAAIAEYDWSTGEITVSVNDVINWYVQSDSLSFTGAEPVGLPAGGGSVSNGDEIIGETTGFHQMTYTDLNLGPVASTQLPLDDLTINWNAGLGMPLMSQRVSYVGGSGNFPPAAGINGPFSANVFTDPLTATLDASTSLDDGNVAPLSYTWDLDNDGIFEIDTGNTPTYEIPDAFSTFGGLGTFPVSVEVFDGELSDVASTTVKLFEDATSINFSPAARIDGPITVNTFSDPLNVLLDASSSTDDGNVAPLIYMWDLDDDGTFEIDTGNTPTFEIADVTATFGGLGTFPVAVEVFDGEFSDVASTTLSIIAENIAPTADINGPLFVNTFFGTPPVTLDASNSSDDGHNQPLSFKWDLDDDGTFEVDSGTNSTYDIADALATFGDLGTFPVAVEVFDGEFVDTASTSIELFDYEPPVYAIYDPETGQVVVTVNGVINWFIESTSHSLTGDDPLNLPAAGGAVSDNDQIIGETTGFISMTYKNLDLGNVAQPGLPPGDLIIHWNTDLSSPQSSQPLNYGRIPEPTSLALAALSLCGMMAVCRWRVV